MLTKNQWLWFADHHKTIRIISMSGISILLVAYGYAFLDKFLWNNKIPLQYSLAGSSQFEKMKCNTPEVRHMFIPSIDQKIALSGDMRNYKPDPLERQDARVLLLENYITNVIGSEILSERPECVGALIADKHHWPEPYALLVVDRDTGKTIFRIARLQDSLTR